MLKASVFGLLFVPGALLAVDFASASLGPRPTEALVHETGLWAIRLLLASLAVTPLRAAGRRPELAQLRRMIGVAAFAYAALHLGAYAAEQAWDLGKVVSEIWLRVYLTIGFLALVILLILAATSVDLMVRLLGSARWRQLHRWAYVAAGLACVHFFLQSKVGVTQPVAMAACALWLGAWRMASRHGAVTEAGDPRFLAGLTGAVVAGTALAEALYHHLKLGAPIRAVLEANLAVDAGTRPAWIVLALGLAVLAGAVWRRTVWSRPAAA
jgi:sulfoxide reductase heme-binding subunit YedZ